MAPSFRPSMASSAVSASSRARMRPCRTAFAASGKTLESTPDDTIFSFALYSSESSIHCSSGFSAASSWHSGLIWFDDTEQSTVGGQ